MSRVLTVARLFATVVLAIFISGTFLVLCGFTEWDIAATVTTLILSVALLYIEIANKSHCVGRDAYTNTLIVCVLLGGASAFFWFFHMIYKIGHYEGDYTDILWSIPTRALAFGMSVQLILRAHRIYTSLTLELIEREFPDQDIEPLSRAPLSQSAKQSSRGSESFNPA